MTEQQLKKKAKRLAKKFSQDLEELFEDECMTPELDDSDFFWVVRSAIQSAIDLSNEEI